ncbi:hypothetical protein C8J57DRAFT_1274509 [Mycena rebaudengoi]|nr:hypothetical protein C8J57DRAFT_1274509 [Mycena rebaudengoi]
MHKRHILDELPHWVGAPFFTYAYGTDALSSRLVFPLLLWSTFIDMCYSARTLAAPRACMRSQTCTERSPARRPRFSGVHCGLCMGRYIPHLGRTLPRVGPRFPSRLRPTLPATDTPRSSLRLWRRIAWMSCLRSTTSAGPARPCLSPAARRSCGCGRVDARGGRGE